MEIFSVYGQVKHIEMPIDRVHASFSKGFAYVEYDNTTEAEKAIKYMNGGKIVVFGILISYNKYYEFAIYSNR